MKRILSFILCAAMVFTAILSLAACNVDEPIVEETEAATEGTDPTEAATNVPTSSATKKKTNKKTTETTDLDEHDLDAFDLAKYLSPVWAGEISYAESAFVKESENGRVEPISLLYPVDEIISVRSADLGTLYVEDVDYYVDDNGDIVILPDGNIPVLAYEDYIFDNDGRTVTAAGGKPQYVAGQPGKQFVYGEISTANGGMSHWVIAVTYKHSSDCILTTPEGKSDELENFIDKLEAGDDVTIVSIGDSITEGWSSSGVKGKRAPYCPPYNEMVADYIQSMYEDSTVEFHNLGISGSTAGGGTISNGQPNGSNPVLLDQVCDYNPDLVMVAYGMNDGGGTNPNDYANRIDTIIKYISEKCPDACIVIVGTTLPNLEMSWSDGGNTIGTYHAQYPEALAAREPDWAEDYNVAVADVTTVNIDMYERKIYQDVTGSNSNHPNDYMHRIYAQVILQTIFGNLAPLA